VEWDYVVLLDERGEVIGTVKADFDFDDIPPEHRSMVYEVISENAIRVHLVDPEEPMRENDPSFLRWPVFVLLIALVTGVPLLYFAFNFQ